jgi:hypothetical protein
MEQLHAFGLPGRGTVSQPGGLKARGPRRTRKSALRAGRVDVAPGRMAPTAFEGATQCVAMRQRRSASPVVCPQTWEVLHLTERDRVRHCDRCQTEVHLCDNELAALPATRDVVRRPSSAS